MCVASCLSTGLSFQCLFMWFLSIRRVSTFVLTYKQSGSPFCLREMVFWYLYQPVSRKITSVDIFDVGRNWRCRNKDGQNKRVRKSSVDAMTLLGTQDSPMAEDPWSACFASQLSPHVPGMLRHGWSCSPCCHGSFSNRTTWQARSEPSWSWIQSTPAHRWERWSQRFCQI